MGASCSSEGTSCSSVFASCKSDYCSSSCSEAAKVVLDATQIDEMIMNAMQKLHDKVEIIVMDKLQCELAKLGIDINVAEVLSPVRVVSPAGSPLSLATHNLSPPQLVLTSTRLHPGSQRHNWRDVPEENLSPTRTSRHTPIVSPRASPVTSPNFRLRRLDAIRSSLADIQVAASAPEPLVGEI